MWIFREPILEDAAYSALGKGPDYAVTPTVLLIEDLHSGVEEVGSLPEEAAEEVIQETARILKSFRKQHNLSGAKIYEPCETHGSPGQRDSRP